MNLANKITLTRLFLVPVMIVFYLIGFSYPYRAPIYDWAMWLSTAIYIIAAITDFLDGKVARKYNMVSNFGKFIDPIADKVLVTAAFIMVIDNGSIPVVFSIIGIIIIITREFLISGLRQCGAVSGKAIAADMFGKVKTFVQDITAPILMMIPVLVTLVGSWVLYVGYAFYGASVLLTILSGINYLIVNRDVIGFGKERNA
ncbi:MAG: CDP-diacylglycerol--glycerol-3-phosphate 3-phosphatidyltransferase [Clostridia bacterium]|nr:CDP-diacylglycerol--glycerol-3-phosphate 3-phosphatidyltransferase [Clostridia bacterium]